MQRDPVDDTPEPAAKQKKKTQNAEFILNLNANSWVVYAPLFFPVPVLRLSYCCRPTIFASVQPTISDWELVIYFFIL